MPSPGRSGRCCPIRAAGVDQGWEASFAGAFEEYARWLSPIGMSPRRVAQPYSFGGVDFAPEDRVFFMFSSGNRDEDCFPNPAAFDLRQDCTPAISFGAGPHFCAGAWISRCLIGDVVLPRLFDRFEGLRLAGPVPFGGWAFRGLPCPWSGTGSCPPLFHFHFRFRFRFRFRFVSVSVPARLTSPLQRKPDPEMPDTLRAIILMVAGSFFALAICHGGWRPNRALWGRWS